MAKSGPKSRRKTCEDTLLEAVLGFAPHLAECTLSCREWERRRMSSASEIAPLSPQLSPHVVQSKEPSHVFGRALWLHPVRSHGLSSDLKLCLGAILRPIIVWKRSDVCTVYIYMYTHVFVCLGHLCPSSLRMPSLSRGPERDAASAAFGTSEKELMSKDKEQSAFGPPLLASSPKKVLCCRAD